MLRKRTGSEAWVVSVGLGHLGHCMSSSSFLRRLLLELKRSNFGSFKVSLGSAERAPGSSASSLLCEQPRASHVPSLLGLSSPELVFWESSRTKCTQKNGSVCLGSGRINQVTECPFLGIRR